MVDRLKFRVWDLVENKYIRLEDWSIWDNCLWVGKYKEEETRAFNFNERYMVEQCTGLKDKNGNLVYDGDIIKLGNNTGEIKFNISFCMYMFGNGFFGGSTASGCEIIGNKYEGIANE